MHLYLTFKAPSDCESLIEVKKERDLVKVGALFKIVTHLVSDRLEIRSQAGIGFFKKSPYIEKINYKTFSSETMKHFLDCKTRPKIANMSTT